MKIFYQYSHIKRLTATSGDYINEMNLIRALQEFATVVYGNTKAKVDISYVRGNPNLFLALKHPKIYFASPYHKQCFNSADAIATFSTEWTHRLKEGVPNTALCNVKVTKPILTMQQVLSPQFKPLQNHPRTKEIRKSLGGGFIIGQFGKMRPTNYPHTFLDILPRLKKEHPEINVVFSDTAGIKSNYIKTRHYPYNQMPYVLSACDLLLFPYWASPGHYSGALRTKEAMACGVPIITARFKAREEELGADYEFYHPVVWGRQHFADVMTTGMYDVIIKAIENDKLRRRVGKRLHKRSEFYSIKNCAKRIKPFFESLIKR